MYKRQVRAVTVCCHHRPAFLRGGLIQSTIIPSPLANCLNECCRLIYSENHYELNEQIGWFFSSLMVYVVGKSPLDEDGTMVELHDCASEVNKALDE